MKIVASETKTGEINIDFKGLAVCRNGYIWLIACDGAVCLKHTFEHSTDKSPPLVYNKQEWERSFNDQGPFTKFNGTLTLEND